MKQEAIRFGENSIIKNSFHQNKKSININEVDVRRIALSDKKSLIKDLFKLDIDMKVMLFHLHYA